MIRPRLCASWSKEAAVLVTSAFRILFSVVSVAASAPRALSVGGLGHLGDHLECPQGGELGSCSDFHLTSVLSLEVCILWFQRSGDSLSSCARLAHCRSAPACSLPPFLTHQPDSAVHHCQPCLLIHPSCPVHVQSQGLLGQHSTQTPGVLVVVGCRCYPRAHHWHISRRTAISQRHSVAC